MYSLYLCQFGLMGRRYLADVSSILTIGTNYCWMSGLNQQVANLSFILNEPQVRILRSAPFWVDMQTG